MKNRRRSTCGFVFALFGMVEGSGLNVVDGPISWQTGRAAALARPKWSVFLRPREIKGCYGYGAISKPCRITELKSGPSSIPSIFEKSELSTCGFIFVVFDMVGDSQFSPVIRHSFCSQRLSRAFTRGAGGAFLPHRPLFQLYSSATPAWFLPWESCPPRLECARCP